MSPKLGHLCSSNKMTEILVKVEDVCGDRVSTRDDGHPLYEKIKECLQQYERVVVEFGEKEIASESFLDEAIVEHYVSPIIPDPISKIVLKGVTQPDRMLLQKIFSYRKQLEEKQQKKNKALQNKVNI